MTEAEIQSARRTSRRAFLRRAFWGTGALGGGAAAYGFGIAPYRPVLERVEAPIRDLPDAFEGFTIAHLSDLHVQPRFPAACLAPAIALVNRAKPDMIALTGDYINRYAAEQGRYMARCIDAVAPLRARDGVFAVFGNHDFPYPPADPAREPWERAGIVPLLDEAVPVRRGGAALWLVGYRSFLQRPVWPLHLLGQTPGDAVRIVLWHEPDRAAEIASGGAALQLSGHTHGGQVALPGLGPLVLPAGGRRYPRGLYPVGGMLLYVTRGVGLLPPLIRLNCPPEVTLLTLRRASPPPGR